ncbi:EVE domain-containing protein [[Limnothrix rosea] IAM M-220]|uniref:EVE domain-containing protein n=1 Tax=[Limnothrix rosea] IAM M-220 TaxID=454133 RepID=UPI000960372E|nr:EVE domain-containing protein [[Limnothrix rosea] IAM M-220]OKH18489.1 EVE domain-containing protein [[Limnothrix rosea] IAM M-220]
MAYWLFQANPKYHRIFEAIRDLDAMPWLVTRYRQQMQPGDGVLVWVAGEQAGVYGIATITTLPEILAPAEIADLDYWTDPSRIRTTKARTNIQFFRKLLGQPLRKHELRFDQTLRNLEVIHTPSRTNFKITPEQWQRVHQLKG